MGTNQWSQQQVNQTSGTNIPVRPAALEPTLEVTRTITLWGGQQAASSNQYMTLSGPATEYTGGLAFWIGQASASLYDFLPVVQGKTRRYVVYRRSVGGIAPASASTLASAFAAIQEGLSAIASFGLTLLQWNISLGKMDNQPVPAHHIGHIKVVTRIIGYGFEGSSMTNFTTQAAVNATITDDVYTGIYHQYLAYKAQYDDLYMGLRDVNTRIAHVEAVYQGTVRDNSMTRGEAYAALPSLYNIQAERQNLVNRGTHAWQITCRQYGWDWRQPPSDPRKGPPPQ